MMRIFVPRLQTGLGLLRPPVEKGHRRISLLHRLRLENSWNIDETHGAGGCGGLPFLSEVGLVTGIYCLAGRNIRITSLHNMVHTMCSAYRSEEGCRLDFSVETGRTEIDFERSRAERSAVRQQPFSDAYLETLAVYRQISEKMPDYDTLLTHCSAVAVDGEAYLFAALSGTGNSTHVRLWRELQGERAVMVNDDKPLLRVLEDGSAVVYGTPWDGKHQLSNNISVPVRAICMLSRGEENRIVRITKAEALPRLLLQVYRPYEPAAMEKTMALLDHLDVAFYRLHCNMDLSAAELSYSVMRGG